MFQYISVYSLQLKFLDKYILINIIIVIFVVLIRLRLLLYIHEIFLMAIIEKYNEKQRNNCFYGKVVH